MPTQRRQVLSMVGSGFVVGIAGCLQGQNSSADEPAVVGETLTLTTTTSSYDTGLLDELHPPFESHYGVTVDVIAQGTGAALETARNGDSDVVMVHARSLEDQFMKDGFGINRRNLMFNDFVVVGPSDDPASIEELNSPVEAFKSIAEAEAGFVSRGDNSGTHVKELAIWDETGVDTGGEWYRETGQGMGETLNIANEQGAYTIADRGTYLSQRSELSLVIHIEGPINGGSMLLANPYGVLAVNPAKHSNVNYDLAMAYIGYITSPEAQSIIESYRVNGEQLFFPRALSEDPTFQQYVPVGWRSDGGTE